MAVAQPNVRVFLNGDYTSIFNAAQQAVVSVEGQIETANWQGGTVIGRTPQRQHTYGIRLTNTIWKLDEQNNWRLDLAITPVNPGEWLNPAGVQDLIGRFIAGLQRWHGQGFLITGYG
jgi:hypothetical protein